MALRKSFGANKSSSKTDISRGEVLPPISAKEWAESESPYSADLVNIKANPNRVTVYAVKDKEVPATTERIPYGQRLESNPTKERMEAVTRIVREVVTMLRKEDKTEGLQVTLTMRIVHPK